MNRIEIHKIEKAALGLFLGICVAGGLMVGKLGWHGNVMRVAPPLVITRGFEQLGTDGVGPGADVGREPARGAGSGRAPVGSASRRSGNEGLVQ